MGYGSQTKKRTFKLVVSVEVDDASNYEAEMTRFCSNLLAEIRAIHRALTGGNINERLSIEQIPNDD